MRWVVFILILLSLSCHTTKYYTCVVIEKSQPYSRIQTVVLGSDSLHFIYPNLTLDEADSLQLFDTIIINGDNLKLKYE